MSQSAFEQYLKNSDHFRDVINTHRRAVADTIAAVLALVRDQDKVTNPMIYEVLKRLDESAGPRSVVDERRLITAMIRDGLK